MVNQTHYKAMEETMKRAVISLVKRVDIPEIKAWMQVGQHAVRIYDPLLGEFVTDYRGAIEWGVRQLARGFLFKLRPLV